MGYILVVDDQNVLSLKGARGEYPTNSTREPIHSLIPYPTQPRDSQNAKLLEREARRIINYQPIISCLEILLIPANVSP